MDYSKVNNALSGWVGSGQRRDRAKAELGEAMQLMQAQQQLQANQDAKEQELNEWQQYIHGMASQIAIRNEDRDKIPAVIIIVVDSIIIIVLVFVSERLLYM